MESSEIVVYIFVLFDLVSFELALYTLVRYKNAVFPTIQVYILACAFNMMKHTIDKQYFPF